jgi:nucleoside-diphosphate-sugar epimerase
VSQFLGHIARGENIRLVDGGKRRRSYTYIDDGIDALMRIIENPGGAASRRIYNIGNPDNQYSVRELAELMLRIAQDYPEYASSASAVKLIEVRAADYYGEGYQDVDNRVPSIEHAHRELGWKPQINLETALRRIFEAYRGDLNQAGQLVSETD